MAYIYEYIRTQGFEPMHFEEHYARLDESLYALFSLHLEIDRKDLQNCIAKALRSGGYSRSTTNAVCVKYTDSGAIEVECVDYLYKTFSLRALRPQCFLTQVSGELITRNTSAKIALLELNHATAQSTNSGVAIWTNEAGEIIAIDGAPAIAVFEDEIRFSQQGAGVEFELAYTAAKGIKRNVTKGAIMATELKNVKELLAVDYRGITAIAGYGEHPYMDITAERLAKEISKIEDCY